MEPNYEAPDGAWYASPEEYIWIGVLGGCGCGWSEHYAELAVKLLEFFNTKHMERDLKFIDDYEVELMAHWLDSKELIEHGGGIGGSWLTEKGKELLKLYQTESTKEADNGNTTR